MKLMELLGRIRKVETKTAGWAAAWLRDDAGIEQLAMIDAYRQSSWVYAAVSARATKLAQVPFKLTIGVRQGEMAVNSGPLFELFQQPHPQLDKFAFWELISTWLDLRGEAFLVGLDAGGRVVNFRERGRERPGRLLVLNPDNFQHVIENHALVGWRYSDGNNSPMAAAMLLPEEVIHIKLPNPVDFWRGASPLSVAMLAVQTDYNAGQFMKGLMLNNADAGILVTVKERLSPSQIEQIRSMLAERKRRAGAADRPLLLPCDAKIEKPALSAADLQFLENRKFLRQEICAIFRVPQTVLGFTEDANRAVDQSQWIGWIHHVIAPLCGRLEAAFQPVIRLFAGRQPVYGWFDIEDLPEMVAARRGRMDAAEKLFAMGVPLNDINRTLDLGLPVYPWGNQGYVPAQMQRISQD